MFPIDFILIKKILDEVNAEDISTFHLLMADISRLPQEIDREDLVEEALTYIEKIKIVEKKFRGSRLEDGQPFKEALKIVNEFYKFYESALKERKLTLQKKISKFANDLDRTERKKKSKIKNLFSASKKLDELEENKNINLHREWAISSIDAEEVDLESLRKYFTDFQLKMAAKKHLQANGPNLEGVQYTKTLII